jgi:hypothetical protein
MFSMPEILSAREQNLSIPIIILDLFVTPIFPDNYRYW